MNFNRKTKLHLEIAALPIVLASLMAPTTVWAQDAAPAADCADADANGVCDVDEGQAIIVTGSRIPRDNFNSASPITVVSRDDTTVAGFNSSSELLQSSSVTAGARQIDNTFGGFITDGGPGANTLSLRSLGAARTLILLNGRRLAPSGTSGSVLSADLNVLPNSIVDRIEILKDGASSIYGSDAIAGVVNIVTDNRVSGMYIDAGVSVPEVGQGTTRRIAVIGGYSSDRFSASGSFEVYDRANLSYGAHDYLQCQVPYTRSSPSAPFGSGDFIDPKTGKAKCYPTGATGLDGVTVNTIGTSTRTLAAGGPGNPAIGTFNRFRYNPAAGGSVPGWEGVNGGDVTGLGRRDTYNNRFFDKSLLAPTRNYLGYGQASYKLEALGEAELYGDFLYTLRNSSQRSFNQAIIDYALGSPLIPAELRFSDLGVMDQLTSRVGVRVFSSRNYTSKQRVEYMRFGGGIRGNLPLGDWTYDLYGGHSYTSGEYDLQQLVTTRLRQSQDVVSNGSGGFVCRDTSNGCVAAPVLTGDVVNGAVPQAFLDFVAPTVTGTTKFWETTFSAQFSGTAFELPAGKVGVAIGAEYRKQRIDDQPSIEQQTGQLYSFSTAGITQGKDSVREVFGEIELPLLRDQPFAHELTINASGRYTDYTSYGSGWTYKVGALYSPIREVSFRGTYGTSFRAPGLSEQFRSPTAGFLSNNVDPCYQYYNRAPTSTRYVNCQAAGVPLYYGRNDPGDPLGQGVRVLTTGGSQTGIAAETSKNWTIGAVVQPTIPGVGKFEFAVDYFNIEVNNGVALYGGGTIIASCYDDPQFTAGTNGGELCRYVTREPAGNVSTQYRATVVNGYVNIADNKVRGMDLNLRYTGDIGPGSLRINAGATRYFEQASRILPTDLLDDDNGEIYTPKWTGDLDVTYKIGKVSLYYGLNWVGAMDSYEAVGEDPATSIYQFRTPDYFTHDASVSVNIQDFRLTAGVRNFTGKEPPQISAYVYNRLGNSPLYSGFDHVGRTFFVNFSAKVF